MTKYKCGHECKMIFLCKDEATNGFPKYLLWKDSVGVNGTKEKCFRCYIKELEKVGCEEK